MKICLFIGIVCLILSCRQKSISVQDGKLSDSLVQEGLLLYNDTYNALSSKDTLKALRINRVAIDKFLAAYQANNKNLSAMYEAARTYCFQGDYEKAAYWMNLCLKTDTVKNNPWNYSTLAYCYLTTGKIDSAISSIKRGFPDSIQQAKEISTTFLEFANDVKTQKRIGLRQQIEKAGLNSRTYLIKVLETTNRYFYKKDIEEGINNER